VISTDGTSDHSEPILTFLELLTFLRAQQVKNEDRAVQLLIRDRENKVVLDAQMRNISLWPVLVGQLVRNALPALLRDGPVDNATFEMFRNLMKSECGV
jgi:hypothetical protein